MPSRMHRRKILESPRRSEHGYPPNGHQLRHPGPDRCALHSGLRALRPGRRRARSEGIWQQLAADGATSSWQCGLVS
jgi:hypothetical protein